MKFLKTKESVAIAEIVVGTLCLCNCFLLTHFSDEKLFDLTLFIHRVISVVLGSTAYFNGMGTYFRLSIIRTTMLNRIEDVLVYLVLNILLICTHVSFKRNYSSSIWSYFDQNLLIDEINRIQLSFVIILVTFTISGVIIVFNLNCIGSRPKHLLTNQ